MGKKSGTRTRATRAWLESGRAAESFFRLISLDQRFLVILFFRYTHESWKCSCLYSMKNILKVENSARLKIRVNGNVNGWDLQRCVETTRHGPWPSIKVNSQSFLLVVVLPSEIFQTMCGSPAQNFQDDDRKEGFWGRNMALLQAWTKHCTANILVLKQMAFII